MIAVDPISRLPTHDVTNVPEPLGDQDLWASDLPPAPR